MAALQLTVSLSQTTSSPSPAPSPSAPCAMAEPYFSSNLTHKRTYDDTQDGPGPSGSRRDSVGSSTSPSGSRERNKRARNDSDSAYASEVDDILISSNTSVSSSTSGSSNSSYHSARSTLSAPSPSLLPVDEDARDEPSALDDSLSSLSAEAGIDISMEDSFPFIPPPASVPTLASASQPQQHPDSAEELRRDLERARAFDREMAALRQSPSRPPQTGSWEPWTAQLPPSLDGPYHALISCNLTCPTCCRAASSVRLCLRPPTPSSSAAGLHRALSTTRLFSFKRQRLVFFLASHSLQPAQLLGIRTTHLSISELSRW